MHWLIAILMAAAAIGAWQVQNWRQAANDKQRIEAAAEKAKFDRRAVDVAATGHEKDKVQIRTEFKTIIQEVERVVEKPFYVASEQCLDDDGLRALNAAIGPASVASQPTGAVPGVKPPHWWQSRRDAEVGR